MAYDYTDLILGPALDLFSPLGHNPIFGPAAPYLRGYMNSPPETALGSDLRSFLKGIDPRTYDERGWNPLRREIKDYFTQPAQPKAVAPAGPPPKTQAEILQQYGTKPQSNIQDVLKEIMKDRTEGVSVNLPPRQSYSEMLPAPPSVVAPNLAGIKPPSATTDFGPARQWMEQAQPKPEEVDPSVMLMSVLGGLATGAANAGRRVGRTNIVDVLAGMGSRGMEGALQGKAYERDITRRNEAARTGYARERGGFEMDVGRATSAEDFRNQNARYGHEVDIGKTAADVINKNADRQYGYASKKAEMDIAAKQANAPQATVHGSNLVTLEPNPDGTSAYTVKPLPTHDPNAALTRMLVLGSGALGAGGGGGLGAGGGGAKSDARKAAENRADEAAARGGPAGTYTAAAHEMARQIVQSKPWLHDKSFDAIQKQLLKDNPEIAKQLLLAGASINKQDAESMSDRILIQLWAENLLKSERVAQLVAPYLRPVNGG